MSDFLIAFLLIFILLAVIIMLQAKMLNLLKSSSRIEEKPELDFIKTGNEDEYIIAAIICAINAFDAEGDFVVKSIKQEDNGWMLYSVLNSNSCDE